MTIRHPALAVFGILALACCLVVPLTAQDKPTPPPRPFSPDASTPRASLPALHLPEYVITGSDLMKFTSDRKRGIELGADEDLSSRAGRGEREKRFQDTSPYRSAMSLQNLPGSSGVFRARAGYGTFYTPTVDAWYGERFSNGDITAHAGFERSAGWVRGSDYTRFSLDAAGGTYLPRDLHPLLLSSRAQNSLHLLWHRYGLFANKTERETPGPEFRRNRLDLGYRADLISRRNSIVDHRVSVFAEYMRTTETLSANDSLDLDEYAHTEAVFGLDASAAHTLFSVPAEARLYAAFYNNTETVAGSGSPLYVRLSARGSRKLDEKWSVDGGVDFYLFRGNRQATQGRLYPSARVRYALMPDITLFAAFDPEVEQRGLRSSMDRNPYLMMSADLEHRQTPLRLKAGMQYDDRDRSSAALWLEYSASNAFPRYSLLGDPVRQQWLLRYDGWVTMVGLHGEGRYRFNDAIDIGGSFVLRGSHSEVLDARMPYIPDVELRSVFGYRVLEDLRVAASVHFFGPRSADTRTLDAVVLLGAEAEYRFMQNAGAFLRFENIADQDYELWQGYQERPFFMQAGLTLYI